MQQKINSLGVDEFQTSDITNSKTPNNIENPSTNASQYNKVYQNQFVKIDTSNISKNNNSPNYISDEYLNITDKKNSNNDQENDINNNSQFHTGRWTEEEHRKFIDGILEYGNEWKKVQQIIKTRSSTQARSHAQKFFLRVKKVIKNNGGNFNINEKDKIIENIIDYFLPNKKGETLTKNQKEKLLSAVSSNIKYEGELKENSDEDFQKVMDEDNLKYRKASNNDLGNKNYKNSIEQNNVDVNNSIFNQRKISTGQKRKISRNIEPKDKIFYIKKDMSHKASLDLPVQKMTNQENNMNEENVNQNNNSINLNEYDLNLNNKYNEYNKKNITLTNINNYCNNNHNINDNFENKNIMNGCIINNYINVTNNYMNNKYICNLCSNDIINNNYFEPYNNDKNDSINDKNYPYFLSQYNDKYSFIDKQFFFGNQFNKDLYNNFNYSNKINNFNENENGNNGNPFELNFNNIPSENFNNNENEHQITVQEDEFIRFNNNNEDNLEYN